MIAVIADDFTGAAEMAGIALQYGLSAVLFTNGVSYQEVDVLIVSTNSRSLNQSDALRVTKKTVESLSKLNPQFIFKKVDSVLRGYVVDELRVQMQVEKKRRAILLPANPSLGRTITGGCYYIHHQKVNETSFASDPEFAMKSAEVLDMLKLGTYDELKVLKLDDEFPIRGIVLGEVATENDLVEWKNKIAEDYVLAGAGDFFESLLKDLTTKPDEKIETALKEPLLFISGTAFQKSADFVGLMAKHHPNRVHYLSSALMNGGSDEQWSKNIAETLKDNHMAVIAIDDRSRKQVEVTALSLRNNMAKVVSKVVDDYHVTELVIEGGSTAAAILSQLNIESFVPSNQLSRGVLRMKAMNKELYITVKPGSYQLPETISKLFIDSL